MAKTPGTQCPRLTSSMYNPAGATYATEAGVDDVGPFPIGSLAQARDLIITAVQTGHVQPLARGRYRVDLGNYGEVIFEGPVTELKRKQKGLSDAALQRTFPGHFAGEVSDTVELR